MKPFKAFPSHHPTPNGSHAKGWVRREWEQGSWTEGCLGMGPGRPIEAHHRRHWALIIGRLYTYSTLDIIYYILYLISSILYSVRYIYIYILDLLHMRWGLACPHTHIYIYILYIETSSIYIYICIFIIYNISDDHPACLNHELAVTSHGNKHGTTVEFWSALKKGFP